MNIRQLLRRYDPIPVAQAYEEEIRTEINKPVELESSSFVGRELDFTEHDPRKKAFWLISGVRQFQPRVLRRLSDGDLLFLAAQIPEHYDMSGTAGGNKIAQNALRARVEIERRAMAGMRWWTAGVSLVSLVVGTVIGAWLK